MYESWPLWAFVGEQGPGVARVYGVCLRSFSVGIVAAPCMTIAGVEPVDIFSEQSASMEQEHCLVRTCTEARELLRLMLARCVSNDLRLFARDPDFESLARLISQHPTLLTPLLCDIARDRPVLFHAIAAGSKEEVLDAIMAHWSRDQPKSVSKP